MRGRFLALDTETTGLDILDNTSPKSPYHRITEIGVVEIIDGEITGRKYQTYLNPEREISRATYAITGHTLEFLKDKPMFSKIADEFLSFIQGGTLVIHNAKFDIKFLNFELSLVHKRNLDINTVIDTLPLARSRYPGQKASLDALCKKFGVDNSNRVFHGALVDAQLLARVYLHMEGFASQLNFVHEPQPVSNFAIKDALQKALLLKEQLSIVKPTTSELDAHAQLVNTLNKSKGS